MGDWNRGEAKSGRLNWILVSWNSGVVEATFQVLAFCCTIINTIYLVRNSIINRVVKQLGIYPDISRNCCSNWWRRSFGDRITL